MTSSAARFVAVIVETSPLKDGKVIVKLSLRTALSHMETGCIAAHILNFDTRWILHGELRYPIALFLGKTFSLIISENAE